MTRRTAVTRSAVQSGKGASAERQVEELVSESYSETIGRVALRCAYGWLNRFSTPPYESAPKKPRCFKSEEGRGERQLSQHACDRLLAAFP